MTQIKHATIPFSAPNMRRGSHTLFRNRIVWVGKFCRFYAVRISCNCKLKLSSYLAFALLLGGCVGAVVAPQLLRAEDAGVYDFIRLNAQMQAAARAHVAQPAPQSPINFSAHPFHAHFVRPRHERPARESQPRPIVRSHPTTPAIVTCDVCKEEHYATPTEAVLHDPTLKRGDTVMLNVGAVVFRGAEHMPYTVEDFVDFRSATMAKTERRQINEVLGFEPKVKGVQVFNPNIRTMSAALDLHRTH